MSLRDTDAALGRLQQAIQRPTTQAIAPNEVKALSILIFIVCLLAEHCDFNSIRDSHPTLQADLSSISEGSITEHVYNSMLKLHAKYDSIGLRARILQCLGFLFRAQPTLMTLESSADLMDKIFESDDQEAHGRLLKIMQDFLLSEATKHAAQEKGLSLFRCLSGFTDLQNLHLRNEPSRFLRT